MLGARYPANGTVERTPPRGVAYAGIPSVRALRGELAMWTTLFAITLAIAIAATAAAVMMGPSARKIRP
jgi:hypothetical protein